MTTSSYTPLTVKTIHDVIDRVCEGSRFSRASLDPRAADLYGIVSTAAATTTSAVTTSATTFYLAYSTWDGRILYVDRRHTAASAPTDDALIYQCLAAIAVHLQCKRLTWQYIDPPVVFPENLSFPPIETLHGWLTLHWPREAYAKKAVAVVPSTNEAGAPSDILQQCCAVATTQAPKNVTIRIAPGASNDDGIAAAAAADLPAITRLVQGLADFEKEPDAVNMTADHYQTDGFCSGCQNLFYCLLLETSNKDDGDDKYVFGMAFIYLGCTKADGRFLYLDDLFIEEPYRGLGAGTAVMQTLATCAVALDCARVVWQALDWNTPALTFYRNLGANVVDGLVTARFAAKDLERVAELWGGSK